MAIELKIDGYFEMFIFNLHTNTEVEEDIEQGVLDNLQQGEYVIGLESKFIYDINDLVNPVYSFSYDLTDSVEYDFDEL